MARTEGQWQKGISLITPSENVPILLRNAYLNFGGDLIGETGYGFRDNAGVMQVKDSGGSWANFGAGGGYTNLTEFVGQTAWRVFYSNGSGDVTELALGADGTLLRSNGAAVAPSFTALAASIAQGGTGLTSIAAKSIWAANAVNTLVELTPGALQSIRMNSGNTAWEVYTPVASGGITWTEVTGTTQAAAVNNGYVLNNAALVTITIPDTAAVGDVIEIVGKGAGGWRIAQNASESINYGIDSTTTGTGGQVNSTNRYDSARLVCITANTTWNIISSIGNLDLV